MHKNYDQHELDKFSTLASRWWDPEGELKTLHQVNPLRLGFIQEQVNLAGKSVIDIGCGGGILAESMAKAGAMVTGIDMNQSVLDAGKLHLQESGIDVEYIKISAEEMASQRPGSYDVVTCLEMLEHVPDPMAIIKACAVLVKPNGHVFFSTLNRNPKSYLFAIVAAEYLLRLLPKNTHDFQKFIRPSELSKWLRDVNLQPCHMTGISYNPFTKSFKLTDDVSVNYLLHAKNS